MEIFQTPYGEPQSLEDTSKSLKLGSLVLKAQSAPGHMLNFWDFDFIATPHPAIGNQFEVSIIDRTISGDDADSVIAGFLYDSRTYTILVDERYPQTMNVLERFLRD